MNLILYVMPLNSTRIKQRKWETDFYFKNSSPLSWDAFPNLNWVHFQNFQAKGRMIPGISSTGFEVGPDQQESPTWLMP